MRHVRLFISSPGDVAPERLQIERVAQRLSGEFAEALCFETFRWEENFYSVHDSVQAQIPEAAACDIVIAVFWKRLGTPLPDTFALAPDGRPYQSGSAYEVLSAIDARNAAGTDKPGVYVFQKTEPATFREDELEEGPTQLRQLRDFLASLRRAGRIPHEFETLDDLGSQVERLLRSWTKANLKRPASAVWLGEKESPFRGLAPFEARHAKVFFGRTRRTMRAIENLKEASRLGVPFLLIVGPSGSGKSSLMRAGVVPRLRSPGVVPSVDGWRTAVMHPAGAASPFEALARALVVTGEHDDPGGYGAALPEMLATYKTVESLTRLLAAGTVKGADIAVADPKISIIEHQPAAHAVVAALDGLQPTVEPKDASRQPSRIDLILLIDQLEELFAAGTDPARVGSFAQLLHALARTGRIWVITTLRANMLDHLILNRPFFALKDAGSTYELGPPGESELTEIVQRSAEASGLVYGRDKTTGEPLDERILRDAFDGDTLPLLEFTLNSLYQRRQQVDGEMQLTVEAYDALGGLDGAIDYAAEQALAGLGESEKKALPRLIGSLVIGVDDQVGSPSERMRSARIVSMKEVCQNAPTQRLVDALVDARILLSFRALGADAAGPESAVHEPGSAYLRIAHERVLKSWKRAKNILDELGDFFRVRADIETHWKRWLGSGKQPDQLVTAHDTLAQAQRALSRYGTLLPDDLRAFIEASRARSQRTKLMRRAAAVVLTAALVVAGIAGGVAFNAQNESRRSYAYMLRTVDNFSSSFTSAAQDQQGVSLRTIFDFNATTLKQLEAKPRTPELDSLRAKILFNLAKISQLAKEWPRASRYADESLKLRQALIDSSVSSLEARWDLTLSLELVGDLRRAAKQRAKASERYLKSLEIRKGLIAAAPNNVLYAVGLSQTYVRLGDLARDARKPAIRYAQESYLAALQSLYHVLAVMPNDQSLQRELSWAYNKLGDATPALADRLAYYEKALCVRRYLAGDAAPAVDKRRAVALRDVSWTLARIAQAKLEAGDPDGAESYAAESLSIRKFISGRDMDNGLYLSDLASSQQQMAEIKARQGKLQEGLSFAQSALWTRKTLAGVGLEKKDKEVLTLNEILVGDLCNRARRERSACIVDQVSWAPFIFQWEAENRRRFLEAPVQAGACWKEITEAFVTPRR